MIEILGQIVDEGNQIYKSLRRREFGINGYIERIMEEMKEQMEEWMKRLEIGNFEDWRERI